VLIAILVISIINLFGIVVLLNHMDELEEKDNLTLILH
jgi:hypothetical protein